MDSAQAAAETARGKVKRASGLIDEALRELKQLVDGDVTTVGTARAHDRESLAAARDLISVGIAKHGAVDVIVIARPTRRAHTHHSANGAQEQTHASSNAGTQAHAQAEGAP